MIAICAWCVKEGSSGVLEEREPLSDPGLTHGVCARHDRELRDLLQARLDAKAALTESAL